jgi:phosphate transport system permease protein
MTTEKDPPSAGQHHGDRDPVISFGADAPDVGTDPTAPPPPNEDAALVSSAEPLAISVSSDAPPVLGAGSSSLGGANGKVRIGDRVFALLTSGASAFVIAIVVLVAVFLVVKSMSSILDDKVNFLTSTEWSPTPGDLRFGVAPLLYTTVMISLVALVIAVPIAIGIALFITQYAPKRIARPVAYVIDLLAAIPSIIYGIWGYSVLSPHLEGVQNALNHIGAIPLFKDKDLKTGTLFDGGVVLAVMILPIITAISRDVFARTPRTNIEAAWALGSTRWEMIRLAVLPYGRPGVVSGAMLGLGRALGETIAVYLILSKVSNFSPSFFSGGETIASKIAGGASEFNNAASTGAYIAAGLVLFILTFIVNAAARWIVSRRKDFA